MPKGKPNQELENRKIAKQQKNEKLDKMNKVRKTDKWKEILEEFIIDEPRQRDKTVSELSILINSAITTKLFNVLTNVLSTTLIKNYLKEKYQDDIYIKNHSTFINEIHLKKLTDEEIKEIWDKI